MADEIGKLLKNEDSSSQIKPAASQKKLRESKKRLNGICRSLLIDTEAYEPKRTANSVDAYIASTEKVDRILYSVISGFIVGLDEKSRDINDKVVCDKNGKKKWNKKVVSGIALLTMIAVVTVICIGISRMSFPQQINIGQHRYQLVEKSTEDSANKLDVDCPEQQEK